MLVGCLHFSEEFFERDVSMKQMKFLLNCLNLFWCLDMLEMWKIPFCSTSGGKAYRYIDDSFCESWAIPWIHKSFLSNIVWEGAMHSESQCLSGRWWSAIWKRMIDQNGIIRLVPDIYRYIYIYFMQRDMQVKKIRCAVYWVMPATTLLLVFWQILHHDILYHDYIYCTYCW